VRQCLAKSSDVGFARIALRLGARPFCKYMADFGFGQSPALPFFGGAAGHILPPDRLGPTELTRGGIGQGIGVSLLQTTVAMSAIANGGQLMRPMLVWRVLSPRGEVVQTFAPVCLRRVVRAPTAQQVIEAMKGVVAPGGTGAAAALPELGLVAKTGTAEKFVGGSYKSGHYYASMAGLLKADAPQLVIAVALDEPQNGHVAGAVVAPVFRAIAQRTAAWRGVH
jgi:cell division protein FtsI/penicillin-binding protein 2